MRGLNRTVDALTQGADRDLYKAKPNVEILRTHPWLHSRLYRAIESITRVTCPASSERCRNHSRGTCGPGAEAAPLLPREDILSLDGGALGCSPSSSAGDGSALGDLTFRQVRLYTPTDMLQMALAQRRGTTR